MVFSERLLFLKCSSNVICVFIIRHLRKIFLRFSAPILYQRCVYGSYYEKIGDIVTCIDGELPFDIPDNWTWSRLNSICSILTDGTHKTPKYSEKGYTFLSSKNVTSGVIDWNNVMYIPEELHSELYSRLAPKTNDILLAKNGTTGSSAIVDRDCVFDIYVSLALIRLIENKSMPNYVQIAIQSPYIQSYFNKSLKGIGVPNLHLEHIRKTLVPIPPLSEQIEINDAFKLINSSIKNIEASLN